MKGHLRKRGDTWYFWAELEPAPDGARRQKPKGGFKTKRDAERAFAEFRDQVRTGTYVPRSKGTLGEFLVNEWLPAISASVRPTTLDHYEQNDAVRWGLLVRNPADQADPPKPTPR